jgi:hypothetical protein
MPKPRKTKKPLSSKDFAGEGALQRDYCYNIDPVFGPRNHPLEAGRQHFSRSSSRTSRQGIA